MGTGMDANGYLQSYAQSLVFKGVPQGDAIGQLKSAAEKLGRPVTDDEAKGFYEWAAATLRAWPIRGLQDAMRNDTKKPPWVIEGLLLKQSATLVSAHPHALKSLSWLAACLEAVARKKVWGHFDAADVERALFIETEDPQWLVEARIRGLAAGLGLGDTLAGFHYVRPGPFDLVQEEPTLRALLRAQQPDFVVLSTLQNLLAGRSLKEQADMAPVAAAIIRLSCECPVVLLTHSPWNKKERRAAGAVTLSANFTTTMHYRKVLKGDETFAHVKLDSKAGGAETDFHVKLLTHGDASDAGSVRNVLFGGSGWPQGATKQAILEIHADTPNATPEEIASEAGCTDRYVRKVLKGANGVVPWGETNS